MSFQHDWTVWLAYLLAAFFCINGVVNIIGPRGMRESFAAWGYPSWFHIVNGTIQLGAGVLLLADATRVLGLGLGILVCMGVFVTLAPFPSVLSPATGRHIVRACSGRFVGSDLRLNGWSRGCGQPIRARLSRPGGHHCSLDRMTGSGFDSFVSA
jgi:hypothetical protein